VRRKKKKNADPKLKLVNPIKLFCIPSIESEGEEEEDERTKDWRGINPKQRLECRAGQGTEARKLETEVRMGFQETMESDLLELVIPDGKRSPISTLVMAKEDIDSAADSALSDDAFPAKNQPPDSRPVKFVQNAKVFIEGVAPGAVANDTQEISGNFWMLEMTDYENVASLCRVKLMPAIDEDKVARMGSTKNFLVAHTMQTFVGAAPPPSKEKIKTPHVELGDRFQRGLLATWDEQVRLNGSLEKGSTSNVKVALLADRYPLMSRKRDPPARYLKFEDGGRTVTDGGQETPSWKLHCFPTVPNDGGAVNYTVTLHTAKSVGIGFVQLPEGQTNLGEVQPCQDEEYSGPLVGAIFGHEQATKLIYDSIKNLSPTPSTEDSSFSNGDVIEVMLDLGKERCGMKGKEDQRSVGSLLFRRNGDLAVGLQFTMPGTLTSWKPAVILRNENDKVTFESMRIQFGMFYSITSFGSLSYGFRDCTKHIENDAKDRILECRCAQSSKEICIFSLGTIENLQGTQDELEPEQAEMRLLVPAFTDITGTNAIMMQVNSTHLAVAETWSHHVLIYNLNNKEGKESTRFRMPSHAVQHNGNFIVAMVLSDTVFAVSNNNRFGKIWLWMQSREGEGEEKIQEAKSQDTLTKWVSKRHVQEISLNQKNNAQRKTHSLPMGGLASSMTLLKGDLLAVTVQTDDLAKAYVRPPVVLFQKTLLEKTPFQELGKSRDDNVKKKQADGFSSFDRPLSGSSAQTLVVPYNDSMFGLWSVDRINFYEVPLNNQSISLSDPFSNEQESVEFIAMNELGTTIVAAGLKYIHVVIMDKPGNWNTKVQLRGTVLNEDAAGNDENETKIKAIALSSSGRMVVVGYQGKIYATPHTELSASRIEQLRTFRGKSETKSLALENVGQGASGKSMDVLCIDRSHEYIVVGSTSTNVPTMFKKIPGEEVPWSKARQSRNLRLPADVKLAAAAFSSDSTRLLLASNGGHVEIYEIPACEVMISVDYNLLPLEQISMVTGNTFADTDSFTIGTNFQRVFFQAALSPLHFCFNHRNLHSRVRAQIPDNTVMFVRAEHWPIERENMKVYQYPSPLSCTKHMDLTVSGQLHEFSINEFKNEVVVHLTLTGISDVDQCHKLLKETALHVEGTKCLYPEKQASTRVEAGNKDEVVLGNILWMEVLLLCKLWFGCGPIANCLLFSAKLCKSE